jgi:hypothetical protein
MEVEVLKKKISTFQGESGRIKITDDQLYMEILAAWEQWKGTSKEFYRAIGVSKTTMAGIIGKAKRMRREGHFPSDSFKEIKLENVQGEGNSFGSSPCVGIEFGWEKGKMIRFQQVDQLVEFLKKVA